MISPSYSLTATERVLPRMALDFTTALLDSRVTFTRTGNTATVTNSSGVIVGINANLPRFDFNPTTLICKGLLIEEARTNALLNSLIDGTDLATQLVTVTAVARTFSFYGTGTVVLSGAHSATVVGTGAYPTRTTLTFTPSAGVLTLTVTGTVQFAQLETGAFATSYIPTEATAVTRNADVATMTGTNFSDWYNPTEGSLKVVYQYNSGLTGTPISISDGTTANRVLIYKSGANMAGFVGSGGSLQANMATNAATTAVSKAVIALKQDNFAFEFNANGQTTDTSGLMPVSPNIMNIGAAQGATSTFNGWISQVYYYTQRLTANEVKAFSKQ